MKTIGEKLKIAREYLGLTQEQVAKTLGISRNAIINIENNSRSVKSNELFNFSKLYGITMEEIVSDEKQINMNFSTFARGFEKLSKKDQQEILNLIKFKNSYKEWNGFKNV